MHHCSLVFKSLEPRYTHFIYLHFTIFLQYVPTQPKGYLKTSELDPLIQYWMLATLLYLKCVSAY